MSIGYAALAVQILSTIGKWRGARKQEREKRKLAERMKRDLRGIATARMREWECDLLNSNLRDHHAGRNKTTRITIKPDPSALVRASRKVGA